MNPRLLQRILRNLRIRSVWKHRSVEYWRIPDNLSELESSGEVCLREKKNSEEF